MNGLVPAAIMHFTVPKAQPSTEVEDIRLKRGAFVIVGLFLGTIEAFMPTSWSTPARFNGLREERYFLDCLGEELLSFPGQMG